MSRSKSTASTLTADRNEFLYAIDDRPALHELVLPGIRRAREGRGGATALLTVIRTIIRCPLLNAWANTIPARTGGGRNDATPDLFWLFYLVAVNEAGSIERLDQEIREHFDEIRKEFYFEHGIALRPLNDAGDAPNYDDFNKWRKRAVYDAKRGDVLGDLAVNFTRLAFALSRAVRRFEIGDVPPNLIAPSIHDGLASDGSVFNVPSDVRRVEEVLPNGETRLLFPGSRAKNPANARFHDPVGNHDKQHGATRGLIAAAVTTKGTASYTRTVLGIEIGGGQDAETKVALRALHRVYGVVGQHIPFLHYDRLFGPMFAQEFFRHYGAICVNANIAAPSTKNKQNIITYGPDLPNLPVGRSVRASGTNKGRVKNTFHTDPISIVHARRDGQECTHHVIGDDGGTHEIDSLIGTRGVRRKIQILELTDLRVFQDPKGEFVSHHTRTGTCAHGGTFDFHHRVAANSTPGSVSHTDPIAAFRVIPEVEEEKFRRVNGRRNQIEAFYSWFEKCFYHKDRFRSWGQQAQQLDAHGAGMLANVEVWAHLTVRIHHARAGAAASGDQQRCAELDTILADFDVALAV